MPRQARLDAPGTFHHVMIRGIESKYRKLDPLFLFAISGFVKFS